MRTGVGHGITKILWAIDAFEDVAQFHKRAAQVLGYFSPSKEAVAIQPVFVMNPNHAEVSPDLATPWIEEYRASAEESLRKIFSQFSLPGLQNPVILGGATSSVSQGVDILSDYALKSEADLILVNSHGRTGFKRLFLGSFAETLLHRSRVPVLVVGQKNVVASKLERIIFPTEFGEHSKELFRRVLDVAHQVGAQVQLLHVVVKQEPPVLDFDYQSTMRDVRGERVPFRVYREHQVQHQTRRTKAWSEFAQHDGVAVEIVIDTESDSVADAILKLSQKNAIGRIIVMEAQSTAIRDSILGSTTKKVVRRASCPVWVLTSHYVEQFFQKAAA